MIFCRAFGHKWGKTEYKPDPRGPITPEELAELFPNPSSYRIGHFEHACNRCGLVEEVRLYKNGRMEEEVARLWGEVDSTLTAPAYYGCMCPRCVAERKAKCNE